MRTTPALLVVAVLLAGCNQATTETTTGASSTSAPPGAAIRASFAGSDQLAVQFTYEGGLVADEADTLIPPFSLYADGRLLVPGIEPSLSIERPVVRPVDVVQLTDEELLSVYGLIAAIGLPEFESNFGSIPFPSGTVADAGNTVVSYFDAAGAVHRYSVHALGAAPADLEAPQPVLRMSELLNLFKRVSDEPGRRSPVAPDRIQLVLLDPPGSGGLNLSWPLEAAPADFTEIARLGRCLVVSGGELTDAVDAFSAGGVRTTWEHEGVRWRLWGRHLLQGEAGCQP